MQVGCLYIPRCSLVLDIAWLMACRAEIRELRWDEVNLLDVGKEMVVQSVATFFSAFNNCGI